MLRNEAGRKKNPVHKLPQFEIKSCLVFSTIVHLVLISCMLAFRPQSKLIHYMPIQLEQIETSKSNSAPAPVQMKSYSADAPQSKNNIHATSSSQKDTDKIRQRDSSGAGNDHRTARAKAETVSNAKATSDFRTETKLESSVGAGTGLESETISQARAGADGTTFQAETGAAQTGSHAGPEAAGMTSQAGSDPYITLIRSKIAQEIDYPPSLKRRRIQGMLSISLTLDPKGEIKALSILKTSGYTELDEITLEAVRNAAPFKNPRVALANSDSLTLKIPISFKLTEN